MDQKGRISSFKEKVGYRNEGHKTHKEDTKGKNSSNAPARVGEAGKKTGPYRRAFVRREESQPFCLKKKNKDGGGGERGRWQEIMVSLGQKYPENKERVRRQGKNKKGAWSGKTNVKGDLVVKASFFDKEKKSEWRGKSSDLLVSTF